MQATVAPPQTNTLREPTPKRIYITRAMCKSLTDSGLLTGRYELIDGEILSKMGQNPLHMITVMLFTAWMMRVFGIDYVFCQGTMDIAASEAETNAPEPDVIALNQPVTAFDRLPVPADILLLVEVSDTTLKFDLQNKALLYARATVREYWVADIVGRRIITHRSPTPSGYNEIVEHGADAILACLGHPDAQVRVSDLLPPVTPEA